MFSPLMESIIERESLPVVCAATLDEFAEENGDVVLFVGGDWHRHVEVNDVAVILPEIVKASGGHLKAAVLGRASEREIQSRYRFNRFPALIFLRDGEYLGVIQKVLDWADYVTEINQILALETTQPPRFEFPEGCAPVAPSRSN
ncbi:hydrogenase accessory protein [Alisedimentitalea sp. MJ-SS2]|uniref:hydrogenase accessory protein n=1 Tax=Aliisedimentitalea sp. MJ-SS2 TaxID=3049795 RepID=UPI00290F5CA5|nr:hydrogenase accessory protein [Alisedimentitalea sp. MJ-SS2]MDU8929648.1 hydrogenase accessory protein [Alisedimentitalea sp. MJ-SS2]